MNRKTKSKSKKNSIKKILASFIFLFFVFGVFNISFNQSITRNITPDISTISLAHKASAVDASEINDVTEKSLQGSKDTDGSWFLLGINTLLYGLFYLFSFLLYVAGLMIDVLLNSKNLVQVIHNPALYTFWEIVRDFLNLGFILFLLFSAFSTVFQIEKYHLLKKNILLMMVLMALLVNFSYPVAMFIVDSSNMLMYYFLQAVVDPVATNQTNYQLMATLTGETSYVEIITKDGISGVNKTVDYTTQILSAIFFTLVLSITLIVLAGIFLVRIMALGILIIFSPVGFVAAVFPDTKEYAHKWWGSLFKYSFIGPALVFIILLAIKMNQSFHTSAYTQSLANSVAGNTSAERDPTFIATIILFFMPITILWVGILAVSSSGVALSGGIVKFAQGAGKKFSGYNWGQKRFKAYKDERDQHAKKVASQSIIGGGLGKKVNKLEDAAHGYSYVLPGSKAARGRREETRKEEERKKIGGVKEIISNAADKHEGTDTSAIVTNINNSITTPPSTKKDKIDLAGQIKQALTRGKEFELEIEAQVENNVAPGTPNRDQVVKQLKADIFAHMRDMLKEAEREIS